MRHRIRPTKEASKFSFFIGILFCIFGLIFLIFIATIGSPALIGIPFMIVWLSIAVYNTYYHYRNGFTDNPIGMYDIDSGDNDTKSEMSISDKLRELEKLKEDGLITEFEYQTKRQEIMKEW